MDRRMRWLVMTSLLVTPSVTTAQQAVTRDWLKDRFLTALHPGPDSVEAQRQAEWVRLRSQPAMLALLIEIFEDTTEAGFVRSNALLRIGATGQPAAYEYLIRRWPELSETEFYSEAILSATQASGDERTRKPCAHDSAPYTRHMWMPCQSVWPAAILGADVNRSPRTARPIGREIRRGLLRLTTAPPAADRFRHRDAGVEGRGERAAHCGLGLRARPRARGLTDAAGCGG